MIGSLLTFLIGGFSGYAIEENELNKKSETHKKTLISTITGGLSGDVNTVKKDLYHTIVKPIEHNQVVKDITSSVANAKKTVYDSVIKPVEHNPVVSDISKGINGVKTDFTKVFKW